MSESIWDLVHSRKIENGTELIWNRKRKGVKHFAVIENGFIKTSDGVLHESPSGAANHLNENKPINGWKCWRLSSDNRLIDELRSK